MTFVMRQQEAHERLVEASWERMTPDEMVAQIESRGDERGREIVRGLMSEAKEAGLWALGHPKEIGGGGLPFLDYVYVNEVVGRIAPKGRVLLVDAPFAAETARASRNIERVTLQEASKLNTLDLAQYAKIIVSSKALDAIIARVNGGKN